MLWSERSVRDQRRRTDRAIHRGGTALAWNPLISKIFYELVRCARERGPRLFEAPADNARHLGVDALRELAQFQDQHFRSPEDWPGTGSSWRTVVCSLAKHLISEYEVPSFLTSCWYANDEMAASKRDWFLRHSRGASFRSLDLPIVMSRKMEHFFLQSPEHLSIELALRRAELLGLGAGGKVVRAILATDMGSKLQDGEFWRTVWHFLIANDRVIEPAQIGPLVDFLQAVRRQEKNTQPVKGLNSPQAQFSMKGRTAASMLRLMQDWHRSLGKGRATFAWAQSNVQPLSLVEPSLNETELPKRWQIIELTDSAALRSEGQALHHCVASYADRCSQGRSSIWSVQTGRGAKLRSVATLEVDKKENKVVQVRGFANRFASGKPLALIVQWAKRERLVINL